ncbi:MAG: lipid-A-disaccharide synthase [Candidatus Lindowbacteria bacterium]|nr:lipid-A-disaccharide synthase [Candidatus Lindowbacteria bacterium]
MKQRRIFIVAGEASGDKHAANLVRAMRTVMPGVRAEGLGGERMQQAGCDLRADLVAVAVMGFVQVVAKLPFFRRLLAETTEYLRQNRPDALVLVDYPGFNLRLAAAAKKLGIPVAYYISPQIWAWRPGRIHKIARLVDKMIVIFPFEEELYRKVNVDVTYVGHPLLDSFSEAELDARFLDGMDIPDPSAVFGILPGSRKQEIRAVLPTLVETAKIIAARMPQARFLIPCSSQGNMELTKTIVGESGIPARLFVGKVYDVARASRCCMVVSGTATLEVAWFLTPLVVVYKTGHLAWLLGRRLLRVPHISLINILAGREIVPEMLQYRMRPELLAARVTELCREGDERRVVIEELKGVREKLGAPGASLRAARAVCELIERTSAHDAVSEQRSVTANGS